MSLVDLKHRLTTDFEQFQKWKRSSDSLVYISASDDTKLKELLFDAPSSLDLTVGDQWFSCADNAFWKIPSSGVTIKPQTSVVLETEQRVGVPLNVFGLVTGKGHYIFQAVIISPGKIDPGFANKLRIGVFNGGTQPITLQSGTAFCSCCFFSLESGRDVASERITQEPSRTHKELPRRKRLVAGVKKHALLIIAIMSVLAALIQPFIYHYLDRKIKKP